MKVLNENIIKENLTKNERSLLKYLQQNEAENQAQIEGAKDSGLPGSIAVFPHPETGHREDRKEGFKSIQDYK